MFHGIAKHVIGANRALVDSKGQIAFGRSALAPSFLEVERNVTNRRPPATQLASKQTKNGAGDVRMRERTDAASRHCVERGRNDLHSSREPLLAESIAPRR